MRKKITDLISKMMVLMEFCVALILIVVILIGGGLLVFNLWASMRDAPELFSVNKFLTDALGLVIGVEFVKMLVKHTPGSVIEVLLFAIARELIVVHSSPVDTLVGVVAVGVIFAIRKFLQVPFTGEEKGLWKKQVAPEEQEQREEESQEL